ncbi:hypothetical protein K2X33_16200, partial [bacterium]|nr:hypothetical protein [bacterium]
AKAPPPVNPRQELLDILAAGGVPPLRLVKAVRWDLGNPDDVRVLQALMEAIPESVGKDHTRLLEEVGRQGLERANSAYIADDTLREKFKKSSELLNLKTELHNVLRGLAAKNPLAYVKHFPDGPFDGVTGSVTGPEPAIFEKLRKGILRNGNLSDAEEALIAALVDHGSSEFAREMYSKDPTFADWVIERFTVTGQGEDMIFGLLGRGDSRVIRSLSTKPEFKRKLRALLMEQAAHVDFYGPDLTDEFKRFPWSDRDPEDVAALTALRQRAVQTGDIFKLNERIAFAGGPSAEQLATAPLRAGEEWRIPDEKLREEYRKLRDEIGVYKLLDQVPEKVQAIAGFQRRDAAAAALAHHASAAESCDKALALLGVTTGDGEHRSINLRQ